MRKFFLRIFLLLIIVVIIVLVVEITVPSFINTFINKKIKEMVFHREDISQMLKTKIKSTPNFKMLLGKIDDLEIKGKDIKIGGLNLQEIKGKLSDVSIDMPSFLSSRKIKINRIETSQIQMEIKEEDLQDYLRQNKDFKDMKIKLKEGEVEIFAEVEILGVKFPATVEGAFRIEKNLIIFAGEKLKLKGRELPDDLTKSVLKKVKPVIDLSPFSLPLIIKDVGIKEGKMIVKGIIKS